VYMLHEMEISTGIELRDLMRIASDVETLVGHDLPGQIMKSGPRLDLHSMGEVATAQG